MKGKNKYQVLCFYPTDGASIGRRYSGCGASSYGFAIDYYSKEKNFKVVSDYKMAVYNIENNIQLKRLKASDFANPKLITNKTPQITTSFAADFNNGCRKVGINNIG